MYKVVTVIVRKDGEVDRINDNKKACKLKTYHG